MDTSKDRRATIAEIYNAMNTVCKHCNYANPLQCNNCPVSWMNNDFKK